MDTITHGVAGALIAKAISDAPTAKHVRRAVILGAILPDLDLLGGLFSSDDLFTLEFHRGITHSLVALPVFAVLLGILTVRRRQGWLNIATGYAIGLASHILLDVITAYGTMIFQPLSTTRYTLDLVFIIDLTFGSILLIPQLVAWAWSIPSVGQRRAWIMWLLTSAGAVLAYVLVSMQGVKVSPAAIIGAVSIFGIAFALPGVTPIGAHWKTSRYCRIGLTACLVYLTGCVVAHARALHEVERIVKKYQIQAIKLAALPSPPSLLNWSGLVQTPDGIARIPVDLAATQEPSITRYANSNPIPNERLLNAIPKVQTYLWFARFPWITATHQANGSIVEFQDLQFLRPSPRAGSPFTFRVQLDPKGNLVAAGLSRR